MANTNDDEDEERLTRQRDDLERQAGVHDETARTRESVVSGYRYIDRPMEAYESAVRELDDDIRWRLREIYFSISDRNTLRSLIDIDRKLHVIWLNRKDGDIRDAEKEVAKAKATMGREPWGIAALVGGACVALGYFGAGLSGSIGGAIVGFFLGQGTLANARSAARGGLEDAENGLEMMKKIRDEAIAVRENFSSDEWLSGERDKAFDHAHPPKGP